MTYQEAIAVRKRQLANQPVDKDELATANRTIAHQRAMGSVFGNMEQAAPTPPVRAVQPPAVRVPLPRGCISVDEWRRTLPASESYQTWRGVHQ